MGVVFEDFCDAADAGRVEAFLVDAFVLDDDSGLFFGVLLRERLSELENVDVVPAGQGSWMGLYAAKSGQLGVGSEVIWHISLGQFYFITVINFHLWSLNHITRVLPFTLNFCG